MIDKLMRARTVVGVAAALLLASGVAFAATEGGSRPAVSQDEASTTSTSVDQGTTSTSVDDESTSTTEASTSTTAAPNASTTTEPEAEHPENHGACVSAAAHDTPPGPDHGKTVSGVARSDCGKPTTASTATTEAENENEAPEQENEAPEQENEQHGSQSGDHGGSDSGDHGGPGQD